MATAKIELPEVEAKALLERARAHVKFVRAAPGGEGLDVEGSVRWGYYEAFIYDDQWWSHRELSGMLDWIETVSVADGRYVAWQTVRSEWDMDVEHWFLRVDVYGYGHETWTDGEVEG